MITLSAPAKINLSLDVTGKLDNGYHTLEMVLQTVSLYDEVRLQKAGNCIEIICDDPLVPKDSSNICHKAARLFFRKALCKSGVKVEIKKRIPVGAGLAGGSTDAAAVLKGLNILFDTGFSVEELAEIGLECGADVPYCLTGGTCLVEGIGEKITKLPSFEGISVILIAPEFLVSTAWVYQNYRMDDNIRHPDTKRLIEAIRCKDLPGFARCMGNVLESVTVVKYPEIEEIKMDLKRHGSCARQMSGSGPTVFGLFEDESKAQTAYMALRKKYRRIFKISTINGGKIYGKAVKN